MGLSPRVRGSLSDTDNMGTLVGSIPACAGQPPGRVHPPERTRVYPRVCGAARADDYEVQLVSGLSPRVRGSPGQLLNHEATDRVYPRVCGAARRRSR